MDAREDKLSISLKPKSSLEKYFEVFNVVSSFFTSV
jgi:hypothetical protein